LAGWPVYLLIIVQMFYRLRADSVSLPARIVELYFRGQII